MDVPPSVLAVRVGLASVWLAFGLYAKLLGLLPRHRAIVAAVVGDAAASPVTLLVGCAETALALWILTGYRPRLAMAAQTAAVLSMNVLELLFAHDLLLAPLPMVAGNAVLLAAGWWAATRKSGRTRGDPAPGRPHGPGADPPDSASSPEESG
jgi:hypothetical protein